MKPSGKLNDRRVDWLIALSSVVVFLVVATAASLEKALAAGVTFGALATVVSFKWASRYDPRFWLLIAFFALIHAAGIITIHIPDVRYGAISIVFAIIDAWIMWSILNWIERRFPRQRG